MDINSLPEIIANDIKKAIGYLQSEDCNEIYIFGSLATPQF